MNVTNLKYKQKGTFAIEFAIVGLFLGILLMVTIDSTIKISTKGKLDRLSFSSVNLLKERTQLYNESYLTTQADANLVFDVVKSSFGRTLANFDSTKFGALIEEQTYQSDGTANTLVTYTEGTNCQPSQTLSSVEGDLSVVTSWGRQATLYRVTLCYETENLIANLLNAGFTTVQSSSVIVGR
jgi:tight adherence protein F